MTREATTSRSEEAMTDRPSSLLWEEARDRETREEIYRFRYEQYFFRREYLPGTDHDGRRVWLPHDDVSRHFLLRTQEGRIVAVGTATPADAPAVCDEWRTMLELDALHDILGLTTIISRVIVAAEERNGPLFGQMCLRLASLLLEEGFRFAVHYCAPAVVSLYERLGYRIYGRGKNLESGAFRLPMMLVADDVEHLRRVRSPLRRAVGGGDTLATGDVLAKSAETIGDYDLLLFGRHASDGETAQTGPVTAAFLGIPQITLATSLDVQDGWAVCTRDTEDSTELVRAKLPALVTVCAEINEPRYATGAGIMNALKKPRATLDCKDLEADPTRCGIPGSPSDTKRLFEPKRDKIDTSIFSGDAAEIARQFVDMLESQHLI